ncbi:hypothetical protein MNV49_000533 [Pseudohyphozyma bogoriensis]|nr:hypothetical protein MNV49_000533 [Pseudohyphozyma bogoriensis]
MAPIANDTIHDPQAEPAGALLPPPSTQARLAKAGINIADGYPYYPPAPKFVSDVAKLRTNIREYVDPATRADPEKKALFSAAKSVRNLTVHIGTEIVGLQLAQLTNQQRDELALLVAERSVVFFRDQDVSPQAQKELGVYLGDGEIEIHPQAAQVPGVGGGVTLIWPDGRQDNPTAPHKRQEGSVKSKSDAFRIPYGASANSFGWHTDLVHEAFPPGYTHLHQDAVPEVGGDTLWASGTAAYDKLSPKFRTLIDGLNVIQRSAHQYLDENNPDAPAKYIERIHPLVRTHPATGWKSLFINRSMTVGIEGLDKSESDVILNYIFDVYERSTDIQVRWSWTPGTSAIWDNRQTIHTVSRDYATDGFNNRHGTRVSSLAEKPYFDPKSQSRREALQLNV